MAGSNARNREEVVFTIVSLLVTEKPSYNIPIPKLESLYRSTESERIPYKLLGYPSIVEFLRTIPQIQLVVRDGTHFINFLGSEKTRELTDLVVKQKTSQKCQRSRSTARTKGPRGVPSGYFSRSQSALSPRMSDNFLRLCSETLEILEKSPIKLTKTILMYKVREKKPGYFDMQTLNDVLHSLGGKVIIDDQMVSAASKVGRQHEISWDSNQQEPPPPKNPVIVRNAQVEEEDESGIDDYGDYDNNQVTVKNDKLVAAISAGQEAPQITQRDARGNEENLGVNDPRTQAEVEMIINERMRFRLEKLIQNCPGGIWCSELAKMYYEKYNLNLEWQQLGFNSLSDLVLHLPDIFYCVQPSPTADFRVFDAKNRDKGEAVMPVKLTLSAIHRIYPDPEDEVRAIPARLSPETGNRLIPEDAVPLGESVGQVLIDSFNQEDKGYEEIVVCDAFTPSFFWIHLRRKIYKHTSMMDEMQVFYDQKASSYGVPLILLEKGLNVVCKFYGKWHRGIVKNIEPDAESTTAILFYDYGTLHKYPANEIYFLHRIFSNLPAQAIPCGLYNIKPPEDYEALRNPDGKVRWSIDTSRRFVQRVHDRPLVAICGKKFYENNSMLLSLTDTSSDEDVNIGEWLVNDGLAVYGSMGVKVDPDDLKQYTEDYDWDRTEDALQKSQATAGNSENNPIIQNLVVNGVIASTRLAERGAQMMGLIDIIKIMNSKGMDMSMIDVESIFLLEKVIHEDWEKYCPEKPHSSWSFLTQTIQNENDETTVPVNGIDQSLNGTRDVACATLELEEELGGFQESLSTSQNAKEIDESQGAQIFTDIHRYVNVQEVPVGLESLDENDMEDLGTFDSGSSIRILDECDESMYSAYDLADTNPFKIDLISRATSPFSEHVEQKVLPPPIPPRTKKQCSMSTLSRVDDEAVSEGNSTVSQSFSRSDIEMWTNHNYLFVQQNGNWTSSEVCQPPEPSRGISVPPGFKPVAPLKSPQKELPKNENEIPEFNSANTIFNVLSTTQENRSFRQPDCLQVELLRGPVFIFFMNGSGWITIDQFRRAFTNFADNLAITNILLERRDETCLRVIRREENPRMFNIIERKVVGSDNYAQARYDAFYLVGVNIVMCKMLRAFGLVSQEDLRQYTSNCGVSHHPVLHDFAQIFRACKEAIRQMNN
ncbi:uncharacterized protein LOC135160829 [Diachasmimorpha longicaudata]|uniref:uncharacterized protein LOC135160829 n=1 Tax=Diachasmimorpha longicaudata TaxID=58733 RepID=UPI0030B8FA6B